MGQKVTISLALDVEEDRDILRFLGQQETGQRSAAIREAIRAQIGRAGVTLGDVYQAVKALERKLEEGAVVGGKETGGQGDKGLEWEEPEAAAAALAMLGRDG